MLLCLAQRSLPALRRQQLVSGRFQHPASTPKHSNRAADHIAKQSAPCQQLGAKDPPRFRASRPSNIDSGLQLLPLLPLLIPLPASADSINYAPGAGADAVKSIAGTAYAALLAFWLFKVIGRRVKRGQSEKLARERSQEEEAEAEVQDDKEVTAGAAAFGALQAGFFTYLLFLLSNTISAYFSSQQLPDQLTAKNITVTIRTAVGGLAYLATFIFGANTLGLAGLAVKLALSPEENDKAKEGTKKHDDSNSSIF